MKPEWLADEQLDREREPEDNVPAAVEDPEWETFYDSQGRMVMHRLKARRIG